MLLPFASDEVLEFLSLVFIFMVGVTFSTLDESHVSGITSVFGFTLDNED